MKMHVKQSEIQHRTLLLTYSAPYSSILFWCELPIFGGIGHGDVSLMVVYHQFCHSTIYYSNYLDNDCCLQISQSLPRSVSIQFSSLQIYLSNRIMISGKIRCC